MCDQTQYNIKAGVLNNLQRGFTMVRINGCGQPERRTNMSIWRVLMCIIFPPLAVIDRGCGSILIVTLLTIVGWVPGVLAALIINSRYYR
jgi:uncharacterized membrane protein YqaE (UPF0057 family)